MVFLVYNGMYFGEIPTFRRSLSPPYFRLMNKPNKKLAEAGVKLSEVCIPISLVLTQSNLTAITSAFCNHR
jgi:hypothetical protein